MEVSLQSKVTLMGKAGQNKGGKRNTIWAELYAFKIANIWLYLSALEHYLWLELTATCDLMVWWSSYIILEWVSEWVTALLTLPSLRASLLTPLRRASEGVSGAEGKQADPDHSHHSEITTVLTAALSFASRVTKLGGVPDRIGVHFWYANWLGSGGWIPTNYKHDIHPN